MTVNQATVLEWVTAIATSVGSLATAAAVVVALWTARSAAKSADKALEAQATAQDTDRRVRADAHAQRIARELNIDSGVQISSRATPVDRGGLLFDVEWTITNETDEPLRDLLVLVAKPWLPAFTDQIPESAILQGLPNTLGPREELSPRSEVWYCEPNKPGSGEPPQMAVRFVDGQGNAWLRRTDNALFMDAVRFVGEAPQPFLTPGAPEWVEEPPAWWITANRTDRSIYHAAEPPLTSDARRANRSTRRPRRGPRGRGASQ